MKGSNTIEINQATIIEALQEYFDRRTTVDGRFVVDSVRWNSSGCGTLEVSISEPQADALLGEAAR